MLGRVDQLRKYWKIGFALLLVGIQVPMLAKSPQNPDGAEMIMAAVQGGVLHSPGYPLQSWLNRVLIHLPFEFPATRLAILSLLSSVATGLVIIEVLELLGVTLFPAIFAVALFCFYPTVWYLALQPEKYSFACFLCSLLILGFLKLLGKGKSELSVRDGVAIGVLFAIAVNQHATAVLFTPFVLGSTWTLLKGNGNRWKLLAAECLSGIAVFLALYLSVFLLTSDTAWPDWGKIQSFKDLFDLMTMVDFKDFHPVHGQAAETVSSYTIPLQLVLQDIWKSLGSISFLCVAGLVFFIFKADRRCRYPFLITLGCHLLFLFVTRYPSSGNLLAESYAERYSVSFILLVAILGGLGAEALLKLPLPKFQLATRAMLALTVPVLFFIGHSKSNAAEDRTLDLFRRGLAISQNPDAYYFAGSDLELFYGYPTPNGIRFPINTDYAWSSRIVPHFDPRLSVFDAQSASVSVQTQKLVFDRGGQIMISDPKTLNGAPRRPIQSGLFWILDPKMTSEDLARNTGRKFAELCQVVEEFKSPRPSQGFRYPRFLFSKFPLAYSNAATYLHEQGDAVGESLCNQISTALFDGKSPHLWIEGCQKLRAQYFN